MTLPPEGAPPPSVDQAAARLAARLAALTYPDASVLGRLTDTAPALADLAVGATAPPFSAQASLGGKVFTFNLGDALKNGPVVLYFYPAAFTKGCTIEAHTFADAMDQFKALHATVIGVSHDTIELRDGTIIEGDVESVDAQNVVVEVGGKAQNLDRNQVKRILLVQRSSQ